MPRKPARKRQTDAKAAFKRAERHARAAAKLGDAALAIRDAKPDRLAFLARDLVQCALPVSDPGDDVRQWVRHNGNTTLTVTATGKKGLPWGCIPRWLLLYVSSEVVRTGNPVVRFGDTLTAFLAALGVRHRGDQAAAVLEQAERLFGAVVRVDVAPDEHGDERGELGRVAAAWRLNRRKGSYIVTLSDEFAAILRRSPVPLDPRALTAIRRCPLALDLYSMLAERLARLVRPVTISWKQLHAVYGGEYAQTCDFARAARRELARIRLLWPGLRYETPRGRLVLYPSPTPVAPRKRAD